MTLVAFTPTPRDPKVAQRELMASFDTIRVDIATCTSVKEAFAIYEHVKYMAAELAALTDLAGARCNTILEEDL